MQPNPFVWQECGRWHPHHTPPPAEAAHASSAAIGLHAEALACEALVDDGWEILGRRLRTAAGEIDIAAERNGLLAFIEVKRRADLQTAARALGPKQRARLIGAAEILIGQNPGWGRAGIRFDVLLLDKAGNIRRIADAFRLE